MATELRNRLIIFFGVLALGLVFLAPTVFKDAFANRTWISKPIALGLDLSGGVHLVYEVQTDEAVKSRLQSFGNSIRSSLRTDKVAVVRSAVNAKGQVEVVLLNDRSEEKAKTTIATDYKELTFVSRESDEGERIRLVYNITPAQAQKIADESVGQAIETLRNRVDQFGVSEPLIQKLGEKRILLQMPGESDIERVKSLVGKVAKLEFRLAPTSPTQTNVITVKDDKGLPVKVEDQSLMSGDSVSDANLGFHEGKVVVDLKFTTKGAQDFGRITSENVGRQLSIILDGVEYSRPVIREPIRDGNCQISGSFTKEDARTLKFVLRSGALPAPLNVMEERTVGPTLGAESIKKGIVSMLIGFCGIILFMAIYYKKSGVLAVGTLVVNLVLMVAGLSAFGATLTLPGLAGLALTLGMAVDSNVIIFERIRDEIKLGATRDAAVRAGFNKALSAILDSNLTTLLSGVILLYFGTGSIRGFAITLSIGIATTIYGATFCSRLGFDSLKLEDSKGLSI